MKSALFYKYIPVLMLVTSILHARPAYAQLNKFNDYLTTCHLTYQPLPSYPSYTESDYTHVFSPDNNFILSLIFYAVKNDQKDILIGFAPMQIMEMDKNSLTYKMFPGDANKNWLVEIKVEADTAVIKPVYFNKTQLAGLNADAAAIYQLKLKQVYLEKYTRCKVVIIHKEHVVMRKYFTFIIKTVKVL